MDFPLSNLTYSSENAMLLPPPPNVNDAFSSFVLVEAVREEVDKGFRNAKTHPFSWSSQTSFDGCSVQQSPLWTSPLSSSLQCCSHNQAPTRTSSRKSSSCLQPLPFFSFHRWPCQSHTSKKMALTFRVILSPHRELVQFSAP